MMKPFVLFALALLLSAAFPQQSMGQLQKAEDETQTTTVQRAQLRPVLRETSEASHIVIITLFFPRLGTENPTSDPNWYYYWKDGGICGIADNVRYESRGSYGFYTPGDDHIHICDEAPTRNTGPETYTDDDGNPITVTGEGIGPHCVAETIAHELLHKKIYEDWNALILAAEADGESDGDDYDDPDDDHIPNIEEDDFLGIATDPNDPDTYNMGGIYSNYGDNEIRCRKKELDTGISVVDSADWAHPGTNSSPPYNP